MKHYLLSVYQPDGPAPTPEMLEPIMRDVNRVNEELQAAGASGPAPPLRCSAG